MNNKRTLLIIGFILAVIAFAALIYFVFIKDLVSPGGNNANTNAAVNQNGNANLPSTNVLPSTNQGGINRNTNQPVTNGALNTNAGLSPIASGGATEAKATINTSSMSAMMAADGKSINFYDKVSGKFYRLDSNGQLVELSDQLFPNATDIAWSPAGDKAVITFPDNSKIVYDFAKKSQVTLPKEWDDIVFSPTGTQLGFKNMTTDETDRWLAVANPDGTEIQAIEPMGDKADSVAVNWSPDGQVMATFRQGISAESQEVLLIGLHGENFKALTTEGRGFEGRWSPSGEQLLYSVYNNATLYNPSLYLVDAKGDTVGANKINIGLQTWTSKCAFSKLSPDLYCAVPDSLPEGAGLIPQLATTTQDTIYKINTNTGARGIVAMPTNLARDRYEISSMFMSADENLLYFQDQKSGKIFSLQLQ
jgi:hypothetical protein